MTLYYFLFLIKPLGEFSLCIVALMGVRGGRSKVVRYPYEETSLGIFIKRCQVPLANRGNEGALSFVPSMMPLEVIWTPEMPLYAVYELYNLPILCLTAQEWGHQRRWPFDMKLHRAASFRGIIRSDPTQRGSLLRPKACLWVLVPRRQWLILVQPTLLIPRAAHSSDLTLADPWAHNEATNSPPCHYIHTSLSPATVSRALRAWT